MIECVTLAGEKRMLPKERLQFRVAAYAVIPYEGKILLITDRHTGKYWFPGGGVELGEQLHDALVREVREETGIEIEIRRFLDFKEVFFYADYVDQAVQNYGFFFLCYPVTFDLTANGRLDDPEAEKSQWVDAANLREQDFVTFGENISALLTGLE